MITSIFKNTGILVLLFIFAISFTACDMFGEDIQEVKELETYSVTVTVNGIAPGDVDLLEVSVSGNDITNETVTPEETTFVLSDLKGNVKIKPELEGYTFDPPSIGVTGKDTEYRGDHGSNISFTGKLSADSRTGILEQVFADRRELKLSGTIYPIDDGGFMAYLRNLDEEIYGSEFTFRLNEGRIVQLQKIVLEDKEYDEIAFNSITDTTEKRARGVQVVGSHDGEENGTTVLSSSLGILSDVEGTFLNIRLDRIGISDIDFSVFGVQVAANHAKIELNSLAVAGEVMINGDYVNFSVADDLEGTVAVEGHKVTLTVDGNIQGNMTIHGYQASCNIDGDIQGNMTIHGDQASCNIDGDIQGDMNIRGNRASCNIDGDIQGNVTIQGQETTITRTGEENITIGGDLRIDEEDLDLTAIKEVIGNVRVDTLAEIDHLIFGANLIINAAEQVVEDLQVPGNLSIRGNDVTVKGGTFGSLAESWGRAVTLEEVTLEKIFDDLTSDVDSNPLEDGDIFTVNQEGWTFHNVTWPLEEFHVNITRENVTFMENAFTGNLTINGWNSTIEDSTIAGNLHISSSDNFLKNVTLEGELTGNAWGTVLENLTVEVPLAIDVNGVTIRESTIQLANKNMGENVTLEKVIIVGDMYPHLSAYSHCRLEEKETFTVDRNGWTFHDVTWPLEEFHVNITSGNVTFMENAFTGNLTINGWNSNIEDSTLAGDLHINSNDATLQDSTLAGDLHIDSGNARIENSKLEGEVHVTGWSTRFIEIEFEDAVFLDGDTAFFNVEWPAAVDVTIGNWETLEFLESTITNTGDLVFRGGNVTLRGTCNLVNSLSMEIKPKGDETFEVTENYYRQEFSHPDTSPNLLRWDGSAQEDGVNFYGYNYTLTDYNPANPEWDEFFIEINEDGVRTIRIFESTDDNMSGTHELTVTHQVTQLVATVTVEITDTAQIETK